MLLFARTPASHGRCFGDSLRYTAWTVLSFRFLCTQARGLSGLAAPFLTSRSAVWKPALRGRTNRDSQTDTSR